MLLANLLAAIQHDHAFLPSSLPSSTATMSTLLACSVSTGIYLTLRRDAQHPLDEILKYADGGCAHRRRSDQRKSRQLGGIIPRKSWVLPMRKQRRGLLLNRLRMMSGICGSYHWVGWEWDNRVEGRRAATTMSLCYCLVGCIRSGTTLLLMEPPLGVQSLLDTARSSTSIGCCTVISFLGRRLHAASRNGR